MHEAMIKQEPFAIMTHLLEDSPPPYNNNDDFDDLLSRSGSLPTPSYQPPDLTKKSHARKQPPGHIPRPRNAFILFRCDFVRQKKVPENVERDHRNISRIAGLVWKDMTEKERGPWMEMAELERTIHLQTYPTYQYPRPGPSSTARKPKFRRAKKTVAVSEEPEAEDTRAKLIAQHWDLDIPPIRRSISEPPGDVKITQSAFESGIRYGAPLITRDDLARRPSRVQLYQTGHADHSSLMSAHVAEGGIRRDAFFLSETSGSSAYLNSLSWSSLPLGLQEWSFDNAPATENDFNNDYPPDSGTLGHGEAIAPFSFAIDNHRFYPYENNLQSGLDKGSGDACSESSSHRLA